MLSKINFGDILTCTETGKTFIAAPMGITTNYARNSAGEIFSDEGVNIRELREMLDRSKPICGYLSNDGKQFTGWKGNELGKVSYWSPCKLTRRSYTHGKDYRSVRVTDAQGKQWTGRGSPGVFIKLRPIGNTAN